MSERPAAVALGAPAAVAEIASVEQLAALVHPVRRRVLAELAEPGSAAEVARRLEIPAQVANYHVRALEAAGLITEVETRRHRNLVERRFRAIARSFALSTALPLSEAQRRRLQSDVALQQLVRAGDSIRSDALRLLEATPAESETEASSIAAAALEIEVALPEGADRTAFVRAVTDAVREAAAPYRRRKGRGGAAETYRMQLVIYPAVGPDAAAGAASG